MKHILTELRYPVAPKWHPWSELPTWLAALWLSVLVPVMGVVLGAVIAGRKLRQYVVSLFQ